MGEANEPGQRSLLERLRTWAASAAIWEHESKLLLVLTLVIGATVGLVVVAFILVSENLATRMYPEGSAHWRRLVMPVAGSLITGFLLFRYFPAARGSGIPQTKAALFLHDGFIRFQTVLGKFFCSSVSLASGIALGREGPSVHVGAGIASVLGRRLGLPPEKVRGLIPVGTSAAVAAAFNTPIAAVLFTLEEIIGNMHAPLLGSVVLGSATAWMVLRLLLGDEPLFHVPAYRLVHPLEFLIYALLGVVGGFVSVAFVKLLLRLRKVFLSLPQHTQWAHPLAGGVLVGVLAWFFPPVLGVGYGYVSQALNGQMALWIMALLVLLKVIATSGCYASGNAGGIFGPSLFIGAMTGGTIGTIAHQLLPDYTASVGAYALVGMGTTFAGIIRAPLTSVIMIFEITRDYSIIVPVMISNLISLFISYRYQREPIYEALHHQDGIHLPPGRQEPTLLVRQAMTVPSTVLSGHSRIEDVAGVMAKLDVEAVPVTGDKGLLGTVTRAAIQDAMAAGNGSRRLSELLPPIDTIDKEELVAESFPHLHVDHTLDFAMRRLGETGAPLLPVVSRSNLRELQGVITLDDILRAYGLSDEKGPAAPEPKPKPKPASAVPLAALPAILIGIIALVSLLAYVHRSQRMERAEESFRLGKELAAEGRHDQAIDRFRDALSISHQAEHRQALAMELIRAGRPGEARLYLNDLLREDPTSGEVNLGMARISVAQGDLRAASTYYNRAIYGTWPEDGERRKIETRLELAEMLARRGANTQAVSELMVMLDELPPTDRATRRRVGDLLLQYGAPESSAEVFSGLVKTDRGDSESQHGLGDALFALRDYVGAREAYRAALRFNPSDSEAEARANLTNDIIALDPTLRRLRVSERFRRSRLVIEQVIEAVEPCGVSDAEALATAKSTVESTRRPRSYGDAVDTNLAVANALWEARNQPCQAAEENHALVHVMELVKQQLSAAGPN